MLTSFSGRNALVLDIGLLDFSGLLENSSQAGHQGTHSDLRYRAPGVVVILVVVVAVVVVRFLLAFEPSGTSELFNLRPAVVVTVNLA